MQGCEPKGSPGVKPKGSPGVKPKGSSGVKPKGSPGLWSPRTLRANLGSRCGLKQSCRYRRDLSNGMSHVLCSQVFRVDSRLLVVRSQTGSSTPGPSFGHNLCYRCLNEQCEPILDIYASRAFHWYKEHHNSLRFDPCNRSLKFRESTETPSPQVGVALGVWVFTPSHSLALSCTPGSMWCDSRASSWLNSRASSCLSSRASFWLNSRASFWLNSRASLWLAPLQPPCLGREPRLGLWHSPPLESTLRVFLSHGCTPGSMRCDSRVYH